MKRRLVDPWVCPACGGAGDVEVERAVSGVPFMEFVDCGECDGTGLADGWSRCRDCGGEYRSRLCPCGDDDRVL